MGSRICYILSAIILSTGILFAGRSISKVAKNAVFANRSVIVKGLSEREAVADLAIWPITIKGAGDDLIALNSKAESDSKTVKDFLLQHGFKEGEFELDNYSVTDLLANTYRSGPTDGSRYIIQATIILKTPNVEAVKKAAAMQYLLAQKGVVFGARNDYDLPGPIYVITKFNELKPQMLSEAIMNARKAAEQFAKDSKSKVGKLKTANQGSFIIGSVDGADADSSGNQERRSIRKKIRVVSTLEYFLE